MQFQEASALNFRISMCVDAKEQNQKKKVRLKFTIVSEEEIQKLNVNSYRFSIILFFAAHLKIKTLTL